jgi:transposase
MRQRELARLQDQLDQMANDNRRQEHRLAKLKKDNDRLRQELDDARRQPHRQAGHFRRSKLKRRKKKSGRRPGHKAELRPIPTPEQIDRALHVPCRVCPDCNVELVDPKIVVQYQTDLPPIVPLVTQFHIETGYCPCCRERVQGRHPQQTSNAIGAAGNTLGPRVLTMAAELKHRLGVPYRRICDFLKTYCDFQVCPATFVRAEQRFAELARPTYNLLIDALRRCGIVHADETGWRVGALNAWLWVFTNKDLTIYTIRTGTGARGHEVPEEILGPDFDGFLIIDGGKAYECLSYAKGQCNAHLLRRVNELCDCVPTDEQTLLSTLITVIQQAIDLAERRDQLTVQGYARRVTVIEERFAGWLLQVARRRRAISLELDRLVNHVANHFDEWLLFLREPELPPPNNHAERMLRPAVITRKVGGCNKTLLGALVHSILASLMVTSKQQGQRFLELARQLWSVGQPQAIALLPPPSTATSAGST